MIEFLENLKLLLKSTFSILKHYSYFGTRFRFIFETKFNFILGRDSNLFWDADSILEHGLDFGARIRFWGVDSNLGHNSNLFLRHSSIYFKSQFDLFRDAIPIYFGTKFRFWSSDSILEHKIVTSRIITGVISTISRMITYEIVNFGTRFDLFWGKIPNFKTQFDFGTRFQFILGHNSNLFWDTIQFTFKTQFYLFWDKIPILKNDSILRHGFNFGARFLF